MQTSRGYRQCARCGSPALRGEALCFWHHPKGRECYRAKQMALKPNFHKLAMFETAGSLDSGKRVWMMARIPKELKAAKSDIVNPYLLVTNGHDGAHAAGVLAGPTS